MNKLLVLVFLVCVSGCEKQDPIDWTRCVDGEIWEHNLKTQTLTNTFERCKDVITIRNNTLSSRKLDYPHYQKITLMYPDIELQVFPYYFNCDWQTKVNEDNSLTINCKEVAE